MMKRISIAVMAGLLMGGCAKSGDGSGDVSNGQLAATIEHRDAEEIREEQVADIVGSTLSGNDAGLTERIEGRAREQIDSELAQVNRNVAALERLQAQNDSRPRMELAQLTPEEQAQANAAAAEAHVSVDAAATPASAASNAADAAADAADAAADAAEAAADAEDGTW